MPYNIVLLGKEEKSYFFLKKAVENPAFQVEFIQYQNLPKLDPTLSSRHLLVLDVTSLTLEEVNDILFRKKKIAPDLPVLALIPTRPIRLRYRLHNLGVNDYQPLPADKLDIFIRIKNLVENNTPFSGKFLLEASSDSAPFLQLMEYAFSVFNQPILNYSLPHFMQGLFSLLKQATESDQIFFFRTAQPENLQLFFSFPHIQAIQDWVLDASRYPQMTKAVRLGEPTVLNSLTSENPLVEYLRSYLNKKISAYAIQPILQGDEIVGVLLLLKYNGGNFTDAHFRLIQKSAQILGWGVYWNSLREDFQRQLDDQVWHYSYDFLNKIMNQLNFGIMVIDRDMRIIYLNKVAASLLGQSTEQLVYKQLWEILDEENVQKILNVYHSPQDFFERPELEIETKEGEKLLVGFTLQDYLNPEGEKEGFIISLKDITYSKEVQEEMRRMDRLASLGVMASGIAHEIRNPLAGIKAIAQTFEQEMPADDPRHEYVSRIIRQVNRLDDLLRSLFSYAKPQKPNRKYHKIESIISEVIKIMQQKFKEHNIRLTESFHPNLPEVYVDASQIQQVLFNLILNSVEAIEKEGEIQIIVQEAQNYRKHFSKKPFFKQLSTHPYVLILIKDNGCGIPEENLRQIFNPFFTTKSFGTGLGLSIVYQIVKENNGIIYYESKVGKGTDCYLFLPAFEPAKNTNNMNRKSGN